MSYRLPHEWDDDGGCIHCGRDGAEDWWLRDRLRAEIGEGEFLYRWNSGEFDEERFCPQRGPNLLG